ncbi:hypothetical protein AV530_011756 [Patagioenas fasciata monilis]|uniref:Uncharacterized protein n=1 Tax=Patagioenas fasciata monilis TaxID=372326 RepID=A0A1V4KLM8_PATFA|nr:hypothetical protein AV530_011756 [Patagioenas fasciata monilis]
MKAIQGFPVERDNILGTGVLTLLPTSSFFSFPLLERANCRKQGLSGAERSSCQIPGDAGAVTTDTEEITTKRTKRDIFFSLFHTSNAF